MALLVTGLAPASAKAHDTVDEARAHFEEARFVDALRALATAEASDDLSRDDLAELYALRATTHLALGNAEEMSNDLHRLAVVDATYTFDRRAPPDLVRGLAEARAATVGTLRFVADPSQVDGGASVAASVSGDELGLVHRVEVFARPAGNNAWQQATDAPLLVSTDGVVEYYAHAIGPGGAVLASVGTPEEPLRFAPRREEVSGGTRRGLVIGLIVAGVALLAGGVAIAVIVSRDEGNTTQVDPFTVRF